MQQLINFVDFIVSFLIALTKCLTGSSLTKASLLSFRHEGIANHDEEGMVSRTPVKVWLEER